jgi:hypothetical protein
MLSHFLLSIVVLKVASINVTEVIKNNLDRHMSDYARRGLLVASYSGLIENIPLSDVLIHSYVNVSGDTQQGLWGVFNT